jgi:hypothetical protein
MLSNETNPFYSENHVKHIHTPCGQSEDFVSVEAGDTYINILWFKELIN